MITEEHAPKSGPWRLVEAQVLPKVVGHIIEELEKKHKLISSGVCCKLATTKDLLSVSSRPTTVKVTNYVLQFSVESP